MKAFTEADMNEAIRRVETAKQNTPQGWKFLSDFGLNPPESYVMYAFTNAKAHEKRLKEEGDVVFIYAASWLQGLCIGVALPK